MIAWAVYLVAVILMVIGIGISSMLFVVPGIACIAAGIVLVFRNISLQNIIGRKRKIRILTTVGSMLLLLCFPGFLVAEKGSPLVTISFYGAVVGVVLYVAALFVYIAGRLIKRKIEAIIEQVADIEKSRLDQTEQYPGKEKVLFKMEASASFVEAVIVNIGVIIAAGMLLLVLLLVRTIFSLGLFIGGLIGIALYLLIDRLIWEKNGIRVVEIDPKGINFYRGREKKLVRIDAQQITEINVFGKLNRRVVNIMLGGSVNRIMTGVTMFSGPRIRITNDLFNDKDFNMFVEKIKELKRADT